MTIEKRLMISFNDLTHVTVTCAKCGIEIRIATAGGAVPAHCPCGNEFDKATSDTLVALEKAYESAQSSQTEFYFDVRGMGLRASRASQDTDAS